MTRALPLALCLVSGTAFAGAPRLDYAFQPNLPRIEDDGDGDAGDEGLERVEKKERGYDMEVNFRGKYLTMPGSILDIWYFNEKDPGWADTDRRPRPRGYGLGLEFVIKSKPKDGVGGANGIFYFDWLASLTDDGYWDDVEEPPDHLDGDYLVPTNNLGLVTVGANYAYEIHMVKTTQTNGNFGLSMLVGGGLGVAFKVGNLERWGPKDGVPGFQRFRDGEPSDGNKRVPGVLPVVDINLAMRFNFADRAVLRIEGGLHDLLFMGATLGIMF